MPYAYKTGTGTSVIASSAVIHPSVVIGDRAVIGHGVVIHSGVTLGHNVRIDDNSVIGKRPAKPGAEVHINEDTYIGNGCVIGATAVIYAGCRLGDRVLIGDGAKLRERCDIWDDAIVGSNCTFQNGVTMMPRSRVIDLSHITAGVIIGNDAFVSTGVLTMNDDSFNGNNPNAPKGFLKPPHIGPGASVGGGAILLPGVHIGNNAVVAAGSIVTKTVPERALVMGQAATLRHDLSYDGTPSPRGDTDD